MNGKGGTGKKEERINTSCCQYWGGRQAIRGLEAVTAALCRDQRGLGDVTATAHRAPAPVPEWTVPGRSGEGAQLGTVGGSGTATPVTGKPGEGHLGKPRESSQLSREPESRPRGCGQPRLLIADHCGPRATPASRGGSSSP